MISRKYFYLLFLILWMSPATYAQYKYPFQNSSLPIDKRADDLIKQLTTEEKISLLLYNSPGVERLNIPKYNWWNEALHGVARAGRATVFPQAIGMAATFNDSLIYKVADAISDEARAKFNAAVKNNNRAQYLGLTFWSPNINIFRDPRWGRGHETYGEDPYLTGRMGTAFVKGMQGNNPDYYKTVACAKHFVVHSGPEPLRHEFNAMVSDNDLRNTYLPAFKTLVTEAKVGGVMCAYNRTDSLPCCTSKFLLQDILRDEWHFKGYVVTDCWALDDIFTYHKFVKTTEEAAALAIKANVNVECGNTLKDLTGALSKKLITPKEIDASLKINLATLFKLGLFDAADKNPFNKIKESVVDNDTHRLLARQTAAQSMVLLSNKNNTLPLKKNINHILITGPNANVSNVLMANYNGNSSKAVNFLEGITGAVSASTIISYNQGCNLTDTTMQDIYWQLNDADAVVAVMGLSPLLEGENGDAYLSEAAGDKKDIEFPYAQLKYLRQLRAKTNKPLIVVITTGSAIALGEVEKIADAVIIAWYPGEEGGNAAADIIFGDTNPAGRLPVTFYQSTADLPPFDNYSMKERTYRYFTGRTLHPFGFGLSYTRFEYDNFKVDKTKDNYTINFNIKNTGNFDGEELAQLYVSRVNKNEAEPNTTLKNFKRVSIKKGATVNISLSISKKDLEYWDEKQHAYVVYPGEYEIRIGSSAEDIKIKIATTIQ
ncbi:glycoside hydrolase family 3 C-terminal domain-containing protein [Ferruginibacter sp. SUN106]|uniref:glycoside hydrolase family 3 C-terminal domain-containing protein n=1 Tax=Ferruginibacter sp. SUN106 TaxID=2978348 RepID=UPI003D35B070